MTRLVLLVALVAGCAAQPPERHLRRPKHLPQAARDLVRRHMAEHAENANQLVWGVVLLDYVKAAEAGRRIADAPRLADPSTSDATELNAQLPERFFILQDELRQRARTVARAAEQEDPVLLADAYGDLARTCVACHATYLSTPPPPAPAPPGR